MTTKAIYFEGIPLKDKNFFWQFCKIEKVEPEFSIPFFDSLIEDLQSKLKQKEKERKEKTTYNTKPNFATGKISYKKIVPFPSSYEQQLKILTSICESIKTNIRINGEEIEPEKKITPAENQTSKKRKSRLTEESISVFYSIIDKFCKDKISIHLITEGFSVNNNLNHYDSAESLRTSFSNFIKNYKEDEKHKKKIDKFLKEKERRKTSK